ncbi:MAG: DUF3006 domain-containing protein [Gemmatimonadetes bacterium]|nr:DUF3006 domain-containing protein [Gemmatimonadota bacterium]MBI2535828.1 DUF3006 domain-containing protein [Gemmatimonadota bacterium]
MPTERLYTVDRIEGASAVLVDDAGATATVPNRALPAGAAEGTVLRVPVKANGQPAWEAARVDPAETARRRAEAEDRIQRLKKRDPGGDIRL